MTKRSTEENVVKMPITALFYKCPKCGKHVPGTEMAIFTNTLKNSASHIKLDESIHTQPSGASPKKL
jgi:hypothetical protein